MNSFNLKLLSESKDEIAARLLSILAPHVVDGFETMFGEATKICRAEKEPSKYLLIFQNIMRQVVNWNATVIEAESRRIVEASKCPYLADLVTAVHVIQLKALSAVRAGQKAKKIDINIPQMDAFVHKVYVCAARNLYEHVFLYDTKAPPLKQLQNRSEITRLVREAVLTAIRDTIQVETLLRCLLDANVEEDFVEDVVPAAPPAPLPSVSHAPLPSPHASHVPFDASPFDSLSPPVAPPAPPAPPASSGGVSFSDVDEAVGVTGKRETIDAPKDIDRLEEIGSQRAVRRKLEEASAAAGEEDEDRLVFDEVSSLSFDDLFPSSSSPSSATEAPAPAASPINLPDELAAFGDL